MGMGLTLGLSLGGQTTKPAPATADLLCQAIGTKRHVSATHKDVAVTLAPHVTYWRGNNQDNLLLDAVEVGGNKPKLSTFRLSDLGSVSILAATFEPFTRFHPDDAKYAGKTRCVVQTVE